MEFVQEQIEFLEDKKEIDFSAKEKAVEYLKKKDKNTQKYLSEQIITYIGNKRSLLNYIDDAVQIVKDDLGKDELTTLDLFSGSGIVARYFKTFASKVYANDLAGYTNRINRCYLMNKSEYNEGVLKEYYDHVIDKLSSEGLKEGFISELYCPKDDTNIQDDERVFYTTRNGKYLDTVRAILEEVPEPYQTLLMGPLLYEASKKTNTAGVFKGFYKNTKTNRGQFGGNGQNALSRILADIELKMPILYDRECEYEVFQEDANKLIKDLPEVDLAYLDPPYNQHNYATNYHLLESLNNNKRPEEVSKVAGIPRGIKNSAYNRKRETLNAMRDLCQNIKAKYVLISFNSDGHISLEDMANMLAEFGDVQVFDRQYNTFRASRNLAERDTYVKEYLYLLKKNKPLD